MIAPRSLFLAGLLAMSALVHAQSPTDTTAHPLKPGWWRIPGTQTRMTLGGYVKADLIHDEEYEAVLVPITARPGGSRSR